MNNMSKHRRDGLHQNTGEYMNQFIQKRKLNIEEHHGILYEYEHVPSGARLLWMSTADNNKLFSVTFKTVPQDNTGVFHILEHSVLCGSEKYPVKDPSMELEKGSVNTFLNAMTFADHTTYPVSSRNEKDFFNLMSVYLDAVFRPKIYENPGIFYQEGWHYEFSSPGDKEFPANYSMTVNGVVYNEMKGVEASVDSRLQAELMRLLYPDTCYQYRFGGHSSEIPTLKYEDFLQKHRQFYRPDHAIFYLEGDLDIEKVFIEIEKYLSVDVMNHNCKEVAELNGAADCKVKKRHIPEIDMQPPISPSHSTIQYPIASDEPIAEHTQMMFGKRIGSFTDREKNFAALMLSDYLTGSLESPLCQCVLENQLGQDVAMIIEDTIKQPYMYIQITNTEPENAPKLLDLFSGLAEELVQDPDFHRELDDIITNFEFKSREQEEPRALQHNMDVLSSYLYGGAPEANLFTRDLFRSLREKLNTDFFDKILAELLDGDTFSVVVAEPSYTKEAEDREKERQIMAEIQAKLSPDQLQQILQANHRMEQWQKEPDSEEARKMIPSLSLADLNRQPFEKPTMELEHEGVRVYYHPAAISDMAYVNIYFPVAAKYQNRLEELSLMGNLLLDLPTEKYDPMTLYQEIVGKLGEFSVEFISTADASDAKTSQTYMVARFCYLKEKAREAVELVAEALIRTQYEEEELISSILNQVLDGFRNEFIESGNVLGTRKAASSWSSRSAATELLEGDACYQNLKKLCDGGQERMDAFLQLMRESAADIFTRDQMIVGVTMPEVADFEKDSVADGSIEKRSAKAVAKLQDVKRAKPASEQDLCLHAALTEYGITDLIHAFPQGRHKEIDMHIVLPRNDEKFPIPSTVSYASASLNLNELGIHYTPAWSLASTILSLEYLWNTIRVQGGAYGTGIRTDIMGNVSFYTYRDPDAEKSIRQFQKCGAFLKEFLASGESLDRYIISCLSGLDPLLSPKDMGIAAEIEYLNGISYEYLCKMYQEILNLKPEDLWKVAEEFEQIADKFTVCIVG